MGASSVAKRRILVVEDEAGITEICQRTLASEGHQVDIADNGAIAEGMVAEVDYDLVIVDIRTPVMNGKQFYEHITKNHPGLVGRVIFTTGDVVSGDTQLFLGQSGSPFLPKPFTPNELKAIVRETLTRLG